MGALDDCAELASHLSSVVSPDRYVMPWHRFPRGINDPSYILNGIGPAFERATQVYRTLDLPTPDPREVVSAWDVFLKEASRIKDDFLSWKTAALAAIPVIGPLVILPAKLSYNVMTNTLGGMVSALYYTSVTGAFGHIAVKDKSTEQFSIHKLVIDGDISPELAAEHAGWSYTGFRLIVTLDELGILRPLKRGGTSGLGALPVVPIIIGAVAAVLILAGAVVISKNLSEVNALRAQVVELKLKVMEDACAKATDPRTISECARGPTADDLSGGTIASEISKALSASGQSLAMWVVIAASVFLGIQLLPNIVGKVKDAKEEAAA